MGKVLSVVSRPFRDYNVESRAHKVISKDKPVAAPKHKASLNEAVRLLKENPEALEELSRKDTMLDAHLKDVYVKSHDQIMPESSERALPLNRRPVEDYEFGFLEPTHIPIGKCSLRQSIQFLANHQADPEIWNKMKIATQYNLSEDKVANVLEYFRVYKVFIPDKDSRAIFAMPSDPKKSENKYIEADETKRMK